MKAVRSPRQSAVESTAKALVAVAGFELLGDGLDRAVESALRTALAGGAVFPEGDNPLAIFRATLSGSICDIETDVRGRGGLLQRFLRDGPYERPGPIPRELRDKRLTAAETARVVTFIYSFMVNSFKGAITELLAAGACRRLMDDPRMNPGLPVNTRLYVGDAVMVRRKSGKGGLKGADLHSLVEERRRGRDPSVGVIGVVEVKSGRKSGRAMAGQLEKHIRRTGQGLIVQGREFGPGHVCRRQGPVDRVLRITVQPSDWPLPRTLRFKKTGKKTRRLVLDPPVPPEKTDLATPLGNGRWHIALRWSKEAIAAAAYEMTFWYMEKVGESIYRDGVPKEWSEMTPAEAGRNAIKQALYYAMRPDAIRAEEARCRRRAVPPAVARRLSRAIALYNTYGFGYALGMNFRNAAGRREMLWPRDLDEIARDGKNRDGCRIA